VSKFTKVIALGAASVFALSTVASADITITSWGGAYTASQQKAYADTYTGGVVNFENYNGGLGEVRVQVESGNVTWDIVDVLPHEARVGCDEGLFEEINAEDFEGDIDADLMVPRPNNCVAPQIFWSYVPFYDEAAAQDNWGDARPTTIADFFDVEKFPGKRGIHTWANALIEMALVADGVAIADVYDVMSSEGGIDRAFAKLDSIKDHVVFWSSGAKPLELVKSGEVAYSLAYNGRIGAAVLSEGESFVTVWDGQVLEEEWLVILKGTKNLAEAKAFVKHATAPAQQAGQAKYINYGPMRKSAFDIMAANEPWFHNGKNIMEHMPNRPDVAPVSVFANPTWWADNGDDVAERFKAWMGN